MRAGRTAKRIRQESAAKRQAAYQQTVTKHNEKKNKKGETNDHGNESGRENPVQ